MTAKGFVCPNCSATNTWVCDTRSVSNGGIVRRRRCKACQHKFVTYEVHAGDSRRGRRSPQSVVHVVAGELRGMQGKIDALLTTLDALAPQFPAKEEAGQ